MSQGTAEGTRVRRVAIISAVVALAVVMAGGIVGAARVIDAASGNPACPSEDWAASTKQELHQLIPSGTRVVGSYTMDCDDQRAVAVYYGNSAKPKAMATYVGREAEAAGWVRRDDPGMPCWEKQVEDEDTSVRIFGHSLEGTWATCGD
ncbi:MAG TPA: hypothetical protein VFX15_15030 [Actinomycetes bacterium]|nr:hypothetical protein [Actinomycetes bacterium]